MVWEWATWLFWLLTTTAYRSTSLWAAAFHWPLWTQTAGWCWSLISQMHQCWRSAANWRSDGTPLPTSLKVNARWGCQLELNFTCTCTCTSSKFNDPIHTCSTTFNLLSIINTILYLLLTQLTVYNSTTVQCNTWSRSVYKRWLNYKQELPTKYNTCTCTLTNSNLSSHWDTRHSLPDITICFTFMVQQQTNIISLITHYEELSCNQLLY